MKAMLYADWMNLRRSMKAIMIAIVVVALASIVSGNGLSFVPAMLCMLSLGARTAHEQRLCLRMG
mgnify:CR=1 FL=1